jgi:type II secretory pathway component GspD/PulD (secretin)
MRWAALCLLLAVVTGLARANDGPQNIPVLPCPQGNSSAPGCNPSKHELKDAKKAFQKGLQLQKAGQAAEAYEKFTAAAQLSPRNIDYVTMREMCRQALVSQHLERGNDQMLKNKQVEALAEFQSALQLDPDNEFAHQRMRDALGEWAPKTAAAPLVVIDSADSEELHITPNQTMNEFHYRGDARGLLTQITTAYGIAAEFDDSVITRQVRFDMGSADFYSAVRAACDVTKTFWTPMTDKQILFAADSPDNRRSFEGMSMRTFQLTGPNDPKALAEIVSLMRLVFESHFVVPEPQKNKIVVRGPQRMLDAATEFMRSLDETRPQVMLDVNVFEISHTLTRNLGLHIPNQFQLFNIPAGALLALGGSNIQDLINQLISGGGINQATSQGISGLLAQLQNQQNSIFSQPLATFGGGLTLMGLTLDPASFQASINESTVKSLEHSYLRAAQGDQATLHIGSRYPILNASFAPVFNTSAISKVIQNNSFQSAFPSFNYEDIGLTMKAKPAVSGNLDVSIELEMQFRALGGTSINGVPVITNREYKGSIGLKDGEPAVIAGSVSRSEQRSLSGIPGLGRVPGLNQILATNNKQESDDELLIVITPHVMTEGKNKQSEVWLAN